MRHGLPSRDIIVGRLLAKATRGRKCLQMLSDISSKTYASHRVGSRRQQQVVAETDIKLPFGLAQE